MNRKPQVYLHFKDHYKSCLFSGWLIPHILHGPTISAISSIVVDLFDSSVTFLKMQVSSIACCNVVWDVSPGSPWEQWRQVGIDFKYFLGFKS